MNASAPASAGYSGTPLARKLGLTQGSTVLLIDAPEDYERLLSPLPARVKFVSRCDAAVDTAHLFVTQRSTLLKHLSKLRNCLKADVPIWVSWPKKAAHIPSDVTDNTIREVALPLGFVDIKVCAVSDVWSGLKVVVRRQDR